MSELEERVLLLEEALGGFVRVLRTRVNYLTNRKLPFNEEDLLNVFNELANVAEKSVRECERRFA